MLVYKSIAVPIFREEEREERGELQQIETLPFKDEGFWPEQF